MQVHLAILVILVLINLIPQRFIDRKKYILPFSFFIILVYWAIRYDYGLDYWEYLRTFYSRIGGKEHRGFGERGYYLFSSLFSSFYQVIIAQSVIVVVTLFHLVRKYIPSSYYWLFFFLLFATPRFHFVMISALRNSLAACIIYWATDLFYVTKKRWGLYLLLVFIAANFHTSALTFFILPLVDILFTNSKGRAVFIFLFVANILSMFYLNRIFNYIINLSSLTESYDIYSETMIETNFMGFLVKSIVLIPTYYICKHYDETKDKGKIRRIFIMAFFFLTIDLLGLNFGGRYTLYLFAFFIIALSYIIQNYQQYFQMKLIILAPYLLTVAYGLYHYYELLEKHLITIYYEGNYLFYHTIFEANPLP